jgi:hypothetical protein
MAMPTSACASAGAVVDAVTRHGDLVAGGLQALHVTGFVRRQHLGEHLVYAELPGDGLSRAL